MTGKMPFYPDICCGESHCMSFPLFGGRPQRPQIMPECGPSHRGCGGRRRPLACGHPDPCSCCRPECPPSCCTSPPVPVRLVNPCNPCESATVLLSVDECGNLQICVRRE